MNIVDLIVIGGGPAGFFGAITAAEINPDLRILILEKGSQVLRKVRISGGGRCNLTHACYDPAELVGHYPRGSKELRGPFTRFGPADMMDWFEQRGVELKTEDDGRVFPASNESGSIVTCLMGETERLGIKILMDCGVRIVEPKAGGFELTLKNGDTLRTNNLLLAAGGGSRSAYKIAESLGHTIIAPVPSLFTFNIKDPRLKDLSGVSVENAELTMAGKGKRKRIQTTGPILITHWGLSGPAVLKLSAWAARELAEVNYKADLTINWLQGQTTESVFDLLKQVKDATPRKQAAKRPIAGIPSRLWRRLVLTSGVGSEQPWNEIPNKTLQTLAQELTAGTYKIEGKGVFKEEFVTCGGVLLKEVDFRTMQSKLVPGLYFAGEFLDIDGLTGGFNFQACWTTGWLAGRAVGCR